MTTTTTTTTTKKDDDVDVNDGDDNAAHHKRSYRMPLLEGDGLQSAVRNTVGRQSAMDGQSVG
jgi:hypothetical protein